MYATRASNKIFSVTVRMGLTLLILRPFPGDQALLSGSELRPRCVVLSAEGPVSLIPKRQARMMTGMRNTKSTPQAQ